VLLPVVRRCDREPRTSDLWSVKAATLMMTGADDAMCTATDTAGWAGQIPAGRSLVVARAGHLAPCSIRTRRT